MKSLSPDGSLYVVVPVFNEADNLADLFMSFVSMAREFAMDYHVKFVLVDDGSIDGTADLAQQLAGDLNFTLLTHRVNQGPGRAFATAFEHLSQLLEENDFVVTMEGDNTSRLELLRQMLTRTVEGYDVILASPYMYGGGIRNTTPLRVMLSHVANAFLKEFIDIHGIHTMSSFFRLYRGSVIRRLQAYYGPGILEKAGFESMIELLLKMIYLKTTISEVPMVLDTSFRKGPSKMKIVATIRGYITLWRDKKRWCRVSKKEKRAFPTMLYRPSKSL
jgi:dolichol-phosphate mannosyltransferase